MTNEDVAFHLKSMLNNYCGICLYVITCATAGYDEIKCPYREAVNVALELLNKQARKNAE